MIELLTNYLYFNTIPSITKTKVLTTIISQDDNLRNEIFQKYFVYNPAVGSNMITETESLTKDDVTNIILADNNFNPLPL